jgi:hypothetical protein
MLGTLEYERLKVAAPNLFRPTAFPLSQKLVFCCCDTVSGESERVRGKIGIWTIGICLLFGGSTE